MRRCSNLCVNTRRPASCSNICGSSSSFFQSTCVRTAGLFTHEHTRKSVCDSESMCVWETVRLYVCVFLWEWQICVGVRETK